jgi:uncharacterized membrane protein YoaK (UPF0700 family)
MIMSENGARKLVFMFAAVAGFVDTVSFIELGMFTAHVTGNIAIAGARLTAHLVEGALVLLVALPVFALAVIAVSLLTKYIGASRGRTILALLVAESLALTIFAGLCLAMAPEDDSPMTGVHLMICASAGVVAMAIQNILMRTYFAHLPATTVMTSNFAQTLYDGVRMLLGERSREVVERVRNMTTALVGFVAGAATGAFAVEEIRFLSFLLPPVIVAVLALREW